MKRFLLGLVAAALLAVAPISAARATQLLPAVTITTAISPAVTGQVLQIGANPQPANVAIQANFIYGSGGTTADAYVQTSLDGGVTWIDVAEFSFTTSSAIKVYNLSSLTPVTTAYTPTDGSLAANTAKDGLIGPRWRVKYKSSGTYGGGTTLQIDIAGIRLTQ